MHAGYGCFLQTYIVAIFKSADIKNWWHKKTALQDLFRPFFRIGITFLGEKLCRFFKPQNAWNTLYLHIDLKGILILKFWLKIHLPGEISNHLIGHTTYFYEKKDFYVLGHRCFLWNGGIENENSIFL